MNWQNNYNIGIASIDEQHQKLCCLITELEKSKVCQEYYHAMSKVIKDLVDYARVHFKDEEKVMSRIGYTYLDHHKILHKQLINQIVTILNDIKCGKTIECNDLYFFLKTWLVDHILIEDKKIADFLFS